MSDNKKAGFGKYGRGYYIALVLCAAAIGITSYVYYRSMEDAPGEAEILEASATPVDEDIPVLATMPKQTKPVTPGTDATEPARKTLQTVFPVEGQEVFGYSMEALSYNRTTRDWRTHNGVDIAAEAGTEVVAAADGEVYTTYEDETLGYTVVIRHEGGYTTCYSSLSQDLRVKAGDQVTMGQVIGTVGTTALVETVLGPHVHFSVTYQDQPMDPAEFFSLN